MKKYSFLIPTYNRSKTIEKCLDSIFSQSLQNFEVIVLDDKSEDDTLNILEKKYKNKIKLIKHKKNMGISVSRNDLIKEVKTEYFTFVDSDDYIDKDLLLKCDEIINKNVNLELLSFCSREMTLAGEKAKDIMKKKSEISKGEDIITLWINEGNTFDTPVCYMYNTKFFKDNKFSYEVGRNHEDFALTPMIILSAQKMISIEDVLYYTVLSDESTVRTINKEKIKRNVYDKLFHYDNLKIKIDKMNLKDYTKKIMHSFLANSILSDINKFSNVDKKEYIKELKKRKVNKDLMDDTLKRKIKKIIVSINYNFYTMF